MVVLGRPGGFGIGHELHDVGVVGGGADLLEAGLRQQVPPAGAYGVGHDGVKIDAPLAGKPGNKGLQLVQQPGGQALIPVVRMHGNGRKITPAGHAVTVGDHIVCRDYGVDHGTAADALIHGFGHGAEVDVAYYLIPCRDHRHKVDVGVFLVVTHTGVSLQLVLVVIRNAVQQQGLLDMPAGDLRPGKDPELGIVHKIASTHRILSKKAADSIIISA